MQPRYFKIALKIWAEAKRRYTGDSTAPAFVPLSDISSRTGFQDPDIMLLRAAGILALQPEGVSIQKDLLSLNAADFQTYIKNRFCL